MCNLHTCGGVVNGIALSSICKGVQPGTVSGLCSTDGRVAAVRIVFFLPTSNSSSDNQTWQRYEEIHREKGYRLEVIHALLEKAGFTSIERLGSLQDFTPPHPSTRRVWFIARKSA